MFLCEHYKIHTFPNQGLFHGLVPISHNSALRFLTLFYQESSSNKTSVSYKDSETIAKRRLIFHEGNKNIETFSDKHWVHLSWAEVGKCFFNHLFEMCAQPGAFH